MTNMRRLLELKQSVWLDYLSRGMTRSGELQSLITDGLRGMTSNPTIFEQAIGHTSDYDPDMTALADSARTDRDIFEALAIGDVREAADLFRPVFDSTDGSDGFVSLEVSPRLAHDTDGSVAEARRLWKALDRPNVMIKILGRAKAGRRSNVVSARESISTLRCCSLSSIIARWRRHTSSRSRLECSEDSQSTESRRSHRCS